MRLSLHAFVASAGLIQLSNGLQSTQFHFEAPLEERVANPTMTRLKAYFKTS